MRVEGMKSRSFNQLCEDVNERIKQLEEQHEVVQEVQTHSTVSCNSGKWVTSYEAILIIK